MFRLSCLFLFGGVLALLIFVSSFQLVTFREGFLPWIKVLIRRTSCDIIDWTGNIVSPLIVVFWMRLVVQPISWCFFVEMILYLHSIRYSCNAWSPTTNERKTERNGINDNKWILEWMNMKWTNLLKGSSPSPYFLDIFYIFSHRSGSVGFDLSGEHVQHLRHTVGTSGPVALARLDLVFSGPRKLCLLAKTV